jgi:hypothetical protein
MSYILKIKAHIIICYLNKYGFGKIKLIIYIMDVKSNLEEVVKL